MRSTQGRIAVIGAGPAGLFFSHFARREGFQVVLFESHSKPGGCASFFRRKFPEGPVLFDAGATVLSSLADGAWLKRAIDSFGVALPEFHPMKQMRYCMNGTLLEIDVGSEESWVASLAKAFPQDRQLLETQFLPRVAMARRMYRLIESGPHLPLQTRQDFVLNEGLLEEARPLAWDFLRGHFRSFQDQLKDWNASAAFMRWMDMHLFITLQAAAAETHPLWGLLAFFFYPMAGAGSLDRGMNGLFEPLLEKLKADPEARVFMKCPVEQIEERGGELICRTAEGWQGPFDYIISSIPRFDSRHLFDSSWLGVDSSFEALKDDLWSSTVEYLVVKDHVSFPEEPFHVHSTRVGTMEEAPEGGDLYCSFSRRGDLTRGPKEWRAVTLSTHARMDEWMPWQKNGKAYRSDPAYLAQKKSAGTQLTKHFLEIFPQAEILLEEPGTPTTFWRYTRRQGGSVGGIPLSQKFTGLRSFSQRTRHPRIFQIGDTSFPGPSVWACAVGARLAMEKLLNKKLSI
jgi:phytoene dehydrogenase-like protein